MIVSNTHHTHTHTHTDTIMMVETNKLILFFRCLHRILLKQIELILDEPSVARTAESNRIESNRDRPLFEPMQQIITLRSFTRTAESNRIESSYGQSIKDAK